jgi:phytoene desaturase
MSKRAAIVIGSGIGGLSVAGLLAKNNWSVKVFEMNEQAGGRANVLEKEGYRFDTGPSWFMVKELFESWYKDMGTTLEEELELTNLSPSYRVFWDKFNAGYIDMYSDPVLNKGVIEELEPNSYNNYLKYLKRGKEQFDISKKYFISKNLKWYNYLNPLLGIQGMRLQIYPNVDKYIKKYFKNDNLQHLLMYHLAFLGSSPYNTSAIYTMMNYVDTLGVYYPKSGIYSLIESMVKLLKSNGGELHLNTKVNKIIVKDGKAIGVSTNVGDYYAEIIISNGHIQTTENNLLSKEYRTHKVLLQKDLAPSAVLIMAGYKDIIKNAQHHNLIFSTDYKKYYDELFSDITLPADPNFYVNIASVNDSSTAPDGCSNISIVVPYPAGIYLSKVEEEEYANKIIRIAMRHFGEKEYEDKLQILEIRSAKFFESRYDAPSGTAIGIGHNLSKTGPLRPQNYNSKLKNLFYVGADTQPGIGMPMCILSGQLTYKRIKGLSL